MTTLSTLRAILPRCVLWILLVLSAAGLRAQHPDAFFSNGKWVSIPAFRDSVMKMMDDIGIPGISFAIIDDGKIVYADGYGYRQRGGGKARVNRKTVFEAASMSKSYLVYAVFKLIEEGKLDLDRPMYLYLENKGLENDPRHKLITPRMILSHSSGIENWRYQNDADSLEIVSDPGTKFVYSGEGYNWLAKVVESILHKPYEEYIQEMVLDPLQLKDSYVEYKKRKLNPFHRYRPDNYAVGYNAWGEEQKKWLNLYPIPACQNNVTARDYAALLLAVFDKKHLSEGSVRTILQPVVSTDTADGRGFYGTGFEIIYMGHDTIVGHGGNNPGFKGEAYYSVVSRKGFAYIVNSDRGQLLTPKFSRLGAGLDLESFWAAHSPFAYPGNGVTLFKIYVQAGATAMLDTLKKMQSAGEIGPEALPAVCYDLMDRDPNLAKYLLEMNKGLYPDCALSYGFLGVLFMRNQQFDSAYANFVRAKELHYKWWNNPYDYKDVERIAKTAEKRGMFLAKIDGKENNTIPADNFNVMHGVEMGPCTDAGKRQIGINLNAGDWVDYKVDVVEPGAYTVQFRVACPSDGNKFNLLSDEKVLTKMEVASTKGWEKWVTLTAKITLPAGNQTLRLLETEGDKGFNINWVKFQAAH